MIELEPTGANVPTVRESRTKDPGYGYEHQPVNGDPESYPRTINERRAFFLGVSDGDHTELQDGYQMGRFITFDERYHAALFKRESEYVMRSMGYAIEDTQDPNVFVGYKMSWWEEITRKK